MSQKKRKIDELFVIPDCKKNKLYKVYCIKGFDNRIIYIGCTKVQLRTRVNGHLSDTFRIGKKKELLSFYIENKKRFTIEVLYDFDDKFAAGITERLLINFYKTHVDGGIINTKGVFTENHFYTPYQSIKHY